MKPDSKSELFSNKTIVFATDFLESSRLSLDYAIGFAHRYGASIIMVHALELAQPAQEVELLAHTPSVTRVSAKDRLEAVAAGVRRLGISVTTRVEQGDPFEAIVRIVRSTKADLLVLGTHGIHRGISHLLLGSNVEKLLMDCPCPTLTIGRHVLAGIDQDLRFNEVLYVSDFSPEAALAAPYALLLGRDFSAPVDVCQLLSEAALSDLFLQEKLSAEYCDAMKRILPDADHYWCDSGFQLEQTSRSVQVLKRAEANNAGIIVLGMKVETHLGRHLHTSFAYELLAKSTCPILTIRGS